MADRSRVFDVASTIVVVVAAVAMVGFQAFGRPTVQAGSPPTTTAFVDTWEEDNESGIWMGSRDARMVITGFMDFTCPYCQQLAPVIDSLMTVHPNDVAFVFQHFPLGRPQSAPAAIAAECAERQGRFSQVYGLIYERLDPAAETPWLEVAEAAGVPHLDEFSSCITLPQEEFPRIEAGRSLGERIGIRGTPTIWINGEVLAIRTLSAFESKLAEIE